MSNVKERRVVEGKIIALYKDLKLCLRESGLTLDADWDRWNEGTKLCAARYHALTDIALDLGMGRYDYDRCQRVIDGLQYPNERLVEFRHF